MKIFLFLFFVVDYFCDIVTGFNAAFQRFISYIRQPVNFTVYENGNMGWKIDRKKKAVGFSKTGTLIRLSDICLKQINIQTVCHVSFQAVLLF